MENNKKRPISPIGWIAIVWTVLVGALTLAGIVCAVVWVAQFVATGTLHAALVPLCATALACAAATAIGWLTWATVRRHC